VHLLPAPSFVLLMQFFASWFVVKLCGVVGLITVDALEWRKLRAFLPVSAAFLACVYANMKTLQFANVETFVVFRASTPLFISIADFCFLGRELPGLRSALCLVCLLLAAVGYTLTDAHFEVRGYVWVAIWYAIFCVDQLYIKHVVDTTAVESNWGRVFYTNLCACLLSGINTLLTEPEVLTWTAVDWSPYSIAALTVSCVLGVAMSYFAFLCRAQVSATCFTVIGNVCKVITVLINITIWDKHATYAGLACLAVSLLAAFLYTPAPLRSVAPPSAGAAYLPVQTDEKTNSQQAAT